MANIMEIDELVSLVIYIPMKEINFNLHVLFQNEFEFRYWKSMIDYYAQNYREISFCYLKITNLS